MATLKETRTRIASVKNTRQVTSAMKMVSAAKLRKSQGIFTKFLPFTEKQHHILTNLARGVEGGTSNPFFTQPAEVSKVLLVSISSNKGLCGAFNANLISETQKRIAYYKAKNVKVYLYTIGRKVNQILGKTENVVSFNDEIQEELTYEAAAIIANELMESFRTQQYDKIELIYNHAKSASSQVVVEEDYLPITPLNEEEEEQGEIDYIFEPNKKEILEVLVPQILRTQFYKTLLDSLVAEHAARMISMSKATDNAGDLLRELKLDYNKARQTAITNEILEIVSGAEALQNG